MSNTKIVIDKDLFDEIVCYLQETKANHISTEHTEIQIDQSIEERAVNETKLNESEINAMLIIQAYQKGATHQQIIEQLKVNELRKWIIDNSNEINIIDIINKIAELTNEKN